MITVCCRAVLFDLDGVLIDSTPAVARVWRKWALEHALDPEKVVQMAHGRPSRTTIRTLLPDADVETEHLEVERQEMADLDGVVPLPGARSLLQSIPPDRWTIATSGTRRLAELRLRASGLPVPKRMITSGDVKLGKPDPEPYRKAAELLHRPASECVVMEDTPAGVLSGKAAGSRVIAFPTTMTRRELEAADADWIVRNCNDIAASCEGETIVLNLTL